MPVPAVKEKFGRVVVAENGGESKILRSAIFSNLDLKWYGLDGDIHPKFEAYRGKKFSLGFRSSVVDSNGERKHFEGKVLLPLNIGEVTAPNLNNLDDLTEAEKKLTQTFGLEVRGNEQMSAFCKFLAGTAGKDPKSKLLLHVSLLTAIRRQISESTDLIEEDKLKYSHLYQIVRQLTEILKGNRVGDVTSALENMEVSEKNSSPLSAATKILRQMFSGIREEALKLGDETDIQPLIDDLLGCLEGIVMDTSVEWRTRKATSKNSRMVIRTTEEARKVALGTGPILEAAALERGIKLDNQIRDSFVFKFSQQLGKTFVRKVHDLITFSNGEERKGCSNEVYSLHVENEWPLEKALGKVMDDANITCARFVEISALLLRLHEGNERVAEYVQSTKEMICAYIQWLGYTSRFHPNLVFDCCIE